MRNEVKELELTKSYSFDVIVADGENSFAGKLELNSQSITLEVMGEESDSRSYSKCRDKIKTLTCLDSNKRFILFNLHCNKWHKKTIRSQNKPIGFFSISYTAEYIIFSPYPVSEKTCGLSLSIHAKKINQWIGSTTTQEEILGSYKKDGLFNGNCNLNEFNANVDKLGLITARYNLSVRYAPSDYSSEVTFPPSLNLLFEFPVSQRDIISRYIQLYNLLALITGSDFEVYKVYIDLDIGYSGSKSTLYYPRAKEKASYSRAILFPLGHNLNFDQLGLPKLPLSIFEQYFSLSKIEISCYEKYLKYQRMQNIEERFLGFFRLLESLCFKSKSYLNEDTLEELLNRAKPYLEKRFGSKKNVASFLKRIPKLNNSKYNTAKCIQDFYSEIPTEITGSWKFKKSDISEICNLRNDITHANDYYITEQSLNARCKFIEILLVLVLFKKIGVSLSDSSQVIDRLHGYILIEN